MLFAEENIASVSSEMSSLTFFLKKKSFPKLHFILTKFLKLPLH